MNDTLRNQPVLSPHQVAASMRATVGALVRATRTVDRLPPIPAAVLDLLDLRGPMTTADLAASRGVRHQTMAVTVKELTDAGCITAAPDPDDGRKKVLTLTAAGKSAIDADRNRRVTVLTEALQTALNEDEQRAVAHALTLIDRITVVLAESASVSASTPDRGPITGAW